MPVYILLYFGKNDCERKILRDSERRKVTIMRRDESSSEKKEKFIMLASSALVLTALTMTGLYMKNDAQKEKDDGYVLDFTAMESRAGNKSEQIAKRSEEAPVVVEDDLDYAPVEVDSGDIEIGMDVHIPKKEEIVEKPVTEKKPVISNVITADPVVEEAPVVMEEVPIQEEPVISGEVFAFQESGGLLRPVEGEVLIPFSMDGSVYFSTLDQYKYNPAVMIVAQEDMRVAACADGTVVNIFHDPEIGQAVTVDLGNGYQLTYGQLKEVDVQTGAAVHTGELVGTVAAPTKYFSLEGANLYLKLTKDGTPIDPEVLFR